MLPLGNLKDEQDAGFTPHPTLPWLWSMNSEAWNQGCSREWCSTFSALPLFDSVACPHIAPTMRRSPQYNSNGVAIPQYTVTTPGECNAYSLKEGRNDSRVTGPTFFLNHVTETDCLSDHAVSKLSIMFPRECIDRPLVQSISWCPERNVAQKEFYFQYLFSGTDQFGIILCSI